MKEPRWIKTSEALQIHDFEILHYGGSHGARDAGLLESALHRPQNQFHYEHKNIIELAAAYAFAISSNHPFIDGNKRTAFVVMTTFLILNDLDITASEVQVVLCFQALAAGEVSEAELAAWLESNTAPRNPPTS